MPAGRPYEALLVDLGDVVMSVASGALDAYEHATGREVPGRGGRDVTDSRWQRHLAGELTADDYWEEVARDGGFPGRRELFRAVIEAVPDAVFDPDALALLHDTRRAGRLVGVLSNDAYSINGPEWFRSRREFDGLDAFVDSTDIGARKPAAEAYLAAAKALDVDPERVVFLDDTPECVEGARAVGMVGVHVDPFARLPAFALARRLLGLEPVSRAEHLVCRAEAVYRSENLEAILALFHPEAVVYWNGEKVAAGRAEIRRFHVERLGFGSRKPEAYELHKVLRAAEGDTIAVEWWSRYDDGGEQVERGAELWTMRADLVLEWHVYHHRVARP